ncbi:MAG TPA: MlaD family protein [Bacteroidota bacterium]|nr:MlaD family protein [Bacteroidota bacterium]
MKETFQSLKKLKIGLTVFVGAAVFIVLMFVVGSESNTFTPTYSIKMFLPNIEGLATGSMVSLGGLKIGSLTAMEFGQQNGQTGITVIMKLRKAYQPQITKGSMATIKTIGMLGDKYVDISIGTASQPPLADGSFIAVKSNKELGDVMDQMTDVISDISATAKNVHAITDTMKHGHGAAGKILCDDQFANELSSVVQKLNSIASSLSEKRGTLGKLLQDDGLYTKLDHTIANLSSVTDSLHNGKGTAGKLLMNDSLYATLQSISHRMDVLLSKMDSDSSSVGPILNSNATIQQLNALVVNINALIADIKENPKKYVHLSFF